MLRTTVVAGDNVRLMSPVIGSSGACEGQSFYSCPSVHPFLPRPLTPALNRVLSWKQSPERHSLARPARLAIHILLYLHKVYIVFPYGIGGGGAMREGLRGSAA